MLHAPSSNEENEETKGQGGLGEVIQGACTLTSNDESSHVAKNFARRCANESVVCIEQEAFVDWIAPPSFSRLCNKIIPKQMEVLRGYFLKG